MDCPKCSQEPIKKECGNLITCKDKSVKDGETLRDHLQKNHPELFTKEHQDKFQCTQKLGWMERLENYLDPLREVVKTMEDLNAESVKMLRGFKFQLADLPPRQDYCAPIIALFQELLAEHEKLEEDYWANVEKHNLNSFPEGPLGRPMDY